MRYFAPAHCAEAEARIVTFRALTVSDDLALVKEVRGLTSARSGQIRRQVTGRKWSRVEGV
jgi:hypothetical protein